MTNHNLSPIKPPHGFDSSELGFGRVFAPHMMFMEWEQGSGWTSPRIEKYAPLQLDPASAVLHYGQELFEGFKAFRTPDSRIVAFRPEANLQRMRNGAARMAMPEIDTESTLSGILDLINLDRDWVPTAPGTSLYVRPTLIASEAFLGVRAATKFTLFVISSPVGSFYGKDSHHLRIWVEPHLTRAAPGGLGASKTSANYAASLSASAEAKKRGYAQVLWLDAREHRFVEEVGTMNLFARIGDELITPPAGDSILAGITRDSVLTLAKDWGLKATMRPLSLDELFSAGRKGTLKELFGTGTAAVIAPVAELASATESVQVPTPNESSWCTRFRDEITGIQYGTRPDRHKWLTAVPVEAIRTVRR